MCKFVESNQVKWLDIHNRPLKFDREAVLKEAVVSVVCLRAHAKFKSANTKVDKGDTTTSTSTSNGPPTVIGDEFYLLAIFDEIMNTMAKVNGKRMWMCKSMGMSQLHDMLLTFYGKERLRYIYLVRDPRDVTLSFMKTPVGDCHPYAISKKWAKLQGHAARVLESNPDLIHLVRYENLLTRKANEVSKIMDFMISRDICKTMRRGSVVVVQNETEMTSNAKSNREASNASLLSSQFKNLTRGASFTKGQFQKFLLEMSDEDMAIVESVAFKEMKELGYEPNVIKNMEDKKVLTDHEVAEFGKTNTKLIEQMHIDLAVDNPDDLERRMRQSSVLKSSFERVVYDEAFMTKSMKLNFKDLVDLDYDDEEEKDRFDVSGVDFSLWPKDASRVGFLSDDEVAERFQIQDTQTLQVGKKKTIRFSAATQRGYYPSDRDKNNQDVFLAGAKIQDGDFKNAFFAVYDGHGTCGDKCAKLTRDIFQKVIANGTDESAEMSNTNDTTTGEGPKISKVISCDKQDSRGGKGSKKRSFFYYPKFLGAKGRKERSNWEVIRNIFIECYKRANHEVSNGTIDATSSGTTAATLCVTKDMLHIANVGDSRCLLVSNVKGSIKAKVLTNDHCPERPEEEERIKKCGGVIMTSSQQNVNDSRVLSFGEPKRVWSKDGKWPGTAFTRSIGDTKAKELGVCADPEITKLRISKNDTMFVLGSDGIFDFISNEAIAEVVSKYSDPSDACKALTGIAYHKWSENEERTDDITVIVGHINHNSSLSSLARA